MRTSKWWVVGTLVPVFLGIALNLAGAQQVRVTVGASATCSVPVATANPKPDSRTGWGLQVIVDGAAFGSRDTSAPYAKTITLSAGVYRVGAAFTRSNTPSVVAVPTYTVTCSAAAVPDAIPDPVNCAGAWEQKREIGRTECTVDGQQTVRYGWTYRVSQPALHGGRTDTCEATDGATRETTEPATCTPPPPPPPPPADEPIFGVVDPTILGTCSAAAHDVHVISGGDGFRYRTWHPQTDPSGCVYAHEHGSNPAHGQDAEINAAPVLFGYVGRHHPMAGEPNGHEEPHEGFKVFIANPGDINDEGRVNRVYSRSVFHMGTGGPRRFDQRLHSAVIRVKHPEFGLKAFTQLMMDTGGVGAVCDPRAQAPVKDVMNLNSPCKLGSGYEIWSTQQIVRNPAGREVYRAFATPAVFDPITVRNPANTTELVYAWDDRMKASRLFPTDDWTRNRGCDRESYAQPGYWYNLNGPTVYWTDALGNPVAAGHPQALLQEISASNSIGAPATRDGLVQFKMRIGFCQQRNQLGLKN